jgi:hypothetical protein
VIDQRQQPAHGETDARDGEEGSGDRKLGPGSRQREFVRKRCGEARRGGHEQRNAQPVAVEDNQVEGRSLDERCSCKQETAGRELARIAAAPPDDEANGDEAPKGEDEDMAALERQLDS